MASSTAELIVKISADLSDLTSSLADASSAVASAGSAISDSLEGPISDVGASFDQLSSHAQTAGEATAEAGTKAEESGSKFGSLTSLVEQVRSGFEGLNTQSVTASSALESIGNAVEGLLGPMGEIAVGALGAGAAMVELSTHTAETAEHLTNMHEGTGVAISDLQTFGVAATQVGISADAIGASIARMQMRFQQLESSAKVPARLQAALETLGLTMRDLEDPTKVLVDVGLKLSDALKGEGNYADVAGAAQQLLGRNMRNSAAAIINYAENQKQLTDEVLRYGLTANEVAEGDETAKHVNELSLAWTELRDKLGAELMPVLDEIVTGLTSLMHATEDEVTAASNFIAQFPPWTAGLGELGSAVNWVSQLWQEYGGSSKSASDANSILNADLLAVAAAMGSQLATAVADVIQKIAEWTTEILNWITQSTAWKSAISWLSDEIERWVHGFNDVVQAAEKAYNAVHAFITGADPSQVKAFSDSLDNANKSGNNLTTTFNPKLKDAVGTFTKFASDQLHLMAGDVDATQNKLDNLFATLTGGVKPGTATGGWEDKAPSTPKHGADPAAAKQAAEDELKVEQEMAAGEAKILEDRLANQKAYYESAYKLGQISLEQEYAALTDIENKKYQAQKDALDKELANLQASGVAKQSAVVKIQEQLQDLDVKHYGALQTLQDKFEKESQALAEKAAQERLTTQQAAAANEKTVDDSRITILEAQLKQRVTLGQESYRQELADQQAIDTQKYNEDRKSFTDRLALLEQYLSQLSSKQTAQIAKTNQEIAKNKADILALDNTFYAKRISAETAADARQLTLVHDALNQVKDAFGSAWDTILNDATSKSTKNESVWKKMFDDLLKLAEKWAEEIAKTLAEAALFGTSGGPGSTAAGGGGGVASLLGLPATGLLGKMFDSFTTATSKFDTSTQSFASSAGSIGKSVNSFGDGIDAFGTTTGGLSDSFSHFSDDLPKLDSAFTNFGGASDNLTGFFSGGAGGKFGGSLTDAFSSQGKLIDSMWQGAFTGSTSQVNRLWTGAFGDSGTVAGDLWSQAFDSSSGAMDSITSGAFTSSQPAVTGTFGTAFSGIGATVQKLFGGAFSGIEKIVSTVFGGAWTGITKIVSTVFGGAFNDIKSVLSTVFKDVFAPILSGLSNIFGSVFSGLGKLLGGSAGGALGSQGGLLSTLGGLLGGSGGASTLGALASGGIGAAIGGLLGGGTGAAIGGIGGGAGAIALGFATGNPIAIGLGALEAIGGLVGLFTGGGRPTEEATQAIAKYAGDSDPVLALLGSGAAKLASAGIPVSSPDAGPVFGPYFAAARALEDVIRWGPSGLTDTHAQDLDAETLSAAMTEMGNPGKAGTATISAIEAAWNSYLGQGGSKDELSNLTGITGFERGGIADGGLALLHKNEMVLPADLSAGLANLVRTLPALRPNLSIPPVAVAPSPPAAAVPLPAVSPAQPRNVNLNFNINALDSADVARWVSQNKRLLSDAVSQSTRLFRRQG